MCIFSFNTVLSVSQQTFPTAAAPTAALSANPQPPGPAPPQAIQRLKEQNRLLTQVKHLEALTTDSGH